MDLFDRQIISYSIGSSPNPVLTTPRDSKAFTSRARAWFAILGRLDADQTGAAAAD